MNNSSSIIKKYIAHRIEQIKNKLSKTNNRDEVARLKQSLIIYEQRAKLVSKVI